MEEYTNIKLVMKNSTEAEKAANIMKRLVSERTPMSKNELGLFANDITVEKKTVIVDESLSLYSNTFCALLPVMLKAVAAETAGFKLDAWFTSCDCAYEARCSAVYTNKKLRYELMEAPDGFTVCCPECGKIVTELESVEDVRKLTGKKNTVCDKCGVELDCELPSIIEEVITID